MHLTWTSATPQGSVWSHRRAGAVLAVASACAGASAQFGGFVDTMYFEIGAFTGANSTSVDVGDVNNDGFHDVVVAYLNFQAVSVALSDGAGGFEAPVVLATAFRPEAPRLFDVTGDGILDLSLVSNIDNTVTIFQGDGAGAFAPLVTIPVAESPIDSIIGDFNGDGTPDLAVAHYTLSRLDVYLGVSIGQFQYGSSVLTTSEPLEIYLDDVNADGDVDFVVSCVGQFGVFDPRSGVSVLANNGAGQFVETSFTPVGDLPLGSASGDLNADGFLDLVTANNDSTDYSIVLSSGDGSFHPETRMAVPVLEPRPTAAAIGDIDGDGRPDIVVGNRSNSTTIGDEERADVFRQTADGGFVHEETHRFTDRPIGISLADLNGDSSPEMAVIFQQSLVAALRNLTPMQAPGDFALLTPPDGAAGLPIPDQGGLWSGSSATLAWSNAPAFHTRYDVYIALDEGMHQVVHRQIGLTEPRCEIPPSVLQPNRTYYWNVTAVNPTGAVDALGGPFRFSTAFRADVSGNGVVDFADLNAVLSTYGQSAAQ
ncbi:MAG: FG-GAP-like repeat-containing protein [Phycisphaerales bacterium]